MMIIKYCESLLSGELLMYTKHICQSIVHSIVWHIFSDDTIFAISNRKIIFAL